MERWRRTLKKVRAVVIDVMGGLTIFSLVALLVALFFYLVDYWWGPRGEDHQYCPCIYLVYPEDS